MAATSDRTGGHGMSKRQEAKGQAAKRAVSEGYREAEAIIPTIDKKAESIPWFRRCPLCWDGNGGVGNCYTTNGSTRYYKCCQSIKPDGCFCGHTWTALVRTEVIKVESRTVHLDSR